jgi:hypothetical protein
MLPVPKIAACIAASTAVTAALAQSPVVISKTLVGSSAHKECLSVADRQSVRYRYHAEAPIDFAILYVDGAKTVYPLKLPTQTFGSGTFTAKARDYCLVWTNGGKQPVLIQLEYARLAH